MSGANFSVDWHVDAATWRAYAAGRLAPQVETAVEAHVTGCPGCRAGASVVAPDVSPVWQGVHERITTPRFPWPLRLLGRLGVRDDDLVVLAAAHSMLVPWAVAVGFAVACACLVGLAGLNPAEQDTAFLAMAPLIPVLAVVAAYDALDPLRELTAPMPYSVLRLALLRATAALAVALPTTAAIGLVVPGMADLAGVWLLPSLGLTLGALVLLTWWDARVTAVSVTLLWTGSVLFVRAVAAADVLAAPALQIGFAAAAAVLAVVLVLRTSTLRLTGGEL